MFDVNTDRVVDRSDLTHWVTDLAHAFFGDANLDGEFHSGDLVSVFDSGQYEDAIPENSTWATGDWDADGDFTSHDLVVAFQEGGYERGLRVNALVATEPITCSPLAICFVGSVGLWRWRRRHV
jgi:hypothetical protein